MRASLMRGVIKIELISQREVEKEGKEGRTYERRFRGKAPDISAFFGHHFVFLE